MASETDSSWPFEDEPHPRVSARLVVSPSLPDGSAEKRPGLEPPVQSRYPHLLEPIPGHFEPTEEWTQSFPGYASHLQAERPGLSSEADLRTSGLVHTSSEIIESPRAIVINHYHYHQSPPPQLPGHHHSILGLHFGPGGESPVAPDTPEGQAALLATSAYLQGYAHLPGTDANPVLRGGYGLPTPNALAEQFSKTNQSFSLSDYFSQNQSDGCRNSNQADYGTPKSGSHADQSPNPVSYLPRPHSESSLKLSDPFQISSNPPLNPKHPRLTPPPPPVLTSSNSFPVRSNRRPVPPNPLLIPPKLSWNPSNQDSSPVTPSKSQPVAFTNELSTRISLPHPSRSYKRPVTTEGERKRARTESPPRSHPPRHPYRPEPLNPILNPMRGAPSGDLNRLPFPGDLTVSPLPSDATGYFLTQGLQPNRTSQLSCSDQLKLDASWLASFGVAPGPVERRSEEPPRAPSTRLLQGALDRFMAHPPKQT